MRIHYYLVICWLILASVHPKPLFCESKTVQQESTMPKRLNSGKYQPLPLGTIKPAGWLKNQLQIQCDGLSGHLDEFWPDIQKSSWFGGSADAWERAPYWLDGVVPLAFLLDDAGLKARVVKYIDFILTHPNEQGWMAPLADLKQYDLWAIMLVFKPLIQYYEATGDARVPVAVENCLRQMDRHIGRHPIFQWAHSRWFETLIAIYWLYEQKPEEWLLQLAVKLHAQGFDWESFFERWPLTERTRQHEWNFMGHVVNNGMAVKMPALWWRLTGSETSRAAAQKMLQLLDTYHGMVTGIFSGDECLAGKNPTQGTELCAVLEYMYSLELLLAIMGEANFGDRLEKVAFNAMPATFAPDMWSHQYDQQVNQVECSIQDRPWTTNGRESNLFGLEPNYGCCTANLSQGWPKFATHLWMQSIDGGLAATAWAPCVVQTGIQNVPVKIEVITEYPFREEILVKVQVAKTTEFPLHLRIPGWVAHTEIRIGDQVWQAEPGTFFEMKRTWVGETLVKIKFPMAPKATRRYRNALAIERGPLVYALKIGEKWQQVNQDKPYRELPHADWEVYATTAWNYALQLNEAEAGHLKFELHPVGDLPFSPEGAPVSVKVPAIRLADWKLENGSAGELPVSPVTASGKTERVTLIPYGCTNLRVTEFPTTK